MENNQAKITISIKEGKFEISGSELFVTQQIENFKSIINKSLSDIEFKDEDKKPDQGSPTQTIENNSTASESEKPQSIEVLYPDIFALDGEKLNIICDIPGSTESKKTLNAALLYSYGQKLSNVEESKVDDIRALCKIHGCLDAANFSSHIKNGNPKLYIDSGSGKDRVIKITRPGEKKAIEIIKEIESTNG